MKIADCRLEKMESVDREERIDWGKVDTESSVSLRRHFSQE
jgi:hypothetical protein